MTVQVTLKDGGQYDVPGDLTFRTPHGEVSLPDVLGVALMGELGLNVFDRFVGFVDEGRSDTFRVLEIIVPVEGVEAPVRLRVLMDVESARELGRRLVAETPD